LVVRIRKDRDENGEFFDQKFAEHWSKLYLNQMKRRDGINVPDMVEAEMDLVMDDSGVDSESNQAGGGRSGNYEENEGDDDENEEE
jgi:hypothetical protein